MIFSPPSIQSFWKCGGGNRGVWEVTQNWKSVTGLQCPGARSGKSPHCRSQSHTMKDCQLQDFSFTSTRKQQVILLAHQTSETICWDPTLYFQPWLLSLKTQKYIPNDYLTSPNKNSMGLAQLQIWTKFSIWPPSPSKKKEKGRKDEREGGEERRREGRREERGVKGEKEGGKEGRRDGGKKEENLLLY